MAAPVKVGHLEAELVPTTMSIQPGQPFWVALRLHPDKEWHVYWRNPGDSGLEPKLKWQLPPGFVASAIQWPYPERIDDGALTSYGYRGEVLLPVKITPPKDLKTSGKFDLKAHAEWLICRVACIPGNADLSLSLPVSASKPLVNKTAEKSFAEFESRLPLTKSDWSVTAEFTDKDLVLTLKNNGSSATRLDTVQFFPYEKNLISHAAKQTLKNAGNGYQLIIPRSQYLVDLPDSVSGILVSSSGWDGGDERESLVFSSAVGPVRHTAAAATANTGFGGVAKALLFAFLGGLILNLMPCVLPVLSLKVLRFVNQASEGRGKAFGHGLIFSAGVLVSFWLLAGLLLALKAGGHQLGWGFQLQTPEFVLVLAGFMFLFGLNLLGVFEIGTSLTGLGGRALARGGWIGSFLNGVVATVVATPCTAPFMGSALGFSLSQPDWVAMLIFTALGLGMATPYLVLSASPALLRLVPKPGAWMESLKHVMGFFLMGTVIWLAWVLGVQAGPNAVAILLITLLLLGVGAWIYGCWGHFGASRRGLASSLAAVVLVVALALGLTGVGATAAPIRSYQSNQDGSISWQPYSRDKVDELRNEGKPVFIDFTAAWCLSCQVNERVAFSSDEVKKKFRELGVQALKADWTARDESITRALAEFGRNSVPLYVMYTPDISAEPIILPEIITPNIILEALTKIEVQRDLNGSPVALMSTGGGQ
jgi:thiol:disulfide interchange protein/DsbC/DsbD-like thiol-disulfide interchange protein